MSFCLFESEISKEALKELKSKCKIKMVSSHSTSKLIKCYKKTLVYIDGNNYDRIYFPLGLWEYIYESFPNAWEQKKITTTFKKELYSIETDPKHRRDQIEVASCALRKLQTFHSVLLECHTGFGKTSLGNFFISKLGVKTLIISHRTIILDQWEEELKTFSTANFVRVKDESQLEEEHDVYIIGAIKASKIQREYFKDIGFVIVDEIHEVTASIFFRTLLKITPKYLLGLSASPQRDDGLHKIFPSYFGNKKEFITRHEIKPFVVYKYCSNFVPEIEYRYNYVKKRMQLDWNVLINSLEENLERQKLIINIAKSHPEDYILILSNRNCQAISLHNLLTSEGEDSELLIGNKREWNTNCRILVAGIKKAGVGFNDMKRTILIMASDVKRVLQYEGRIRTDNCIIYDLRDHYRTLESHWKLREAWYLKRGATIKHIGETIGFDYSNDNTNYFLRPSRRLLK